MSVTGFLAVGTGMIWSQGCSAGYNKGETDVIYKQLQNGSKVLRRSAAHEHDPTVDNVN